MAGPIATESQSVSPIPQGQGDALNIGQLLQNIMGSNQGQLAELAKKAATPIPGGHATALPLSMDPTPKQFQPASYDNREVVGKGNARAQGIGNSIIGVMNAIGATKTALDNKKKLEVASATQQLLTAQQAYDQAAQLSKSDPSNADAKAAMERNKAVMNGILSNDKIRKAIEEGMHVNFMDHSENNTLNHQAVAQGKQMAKAHVDYAEQFNTQTPQVMGPNVQAQAQYQAAAQQQKLQTEAMRAIIPLLSAQTRVQGQLKSEEMKLTFQKSLALAKSSDAWDRLNERFRQQKLLQNNAHLNRLSEISAEGTKELNVFKQKMFDVDQTKAVTAYNAFHTKTSGQLAAMDAHLANMREARENLAQHVKYGKNPTTGEGGYNASVAGLDQDIKDAEEARTGLKQLIDDNESLYKQRYSMLGESDGSGTRTDTTDSSTIDLGNSDTYLDDESAPN